MRVARLFGIVLAFVAAAWVGGLFRASEPPPVQAATSPVTQETPVKDQAGLASVVIGGGCFWCTEALFEELQGVVSVESGYAGGHVPNPTYEQVCNKDTGHAEVVKVTFDPSVISFRELLDVHFLTHDPTTLNRQGADTGPQYRSVIFYRTEEEKKDAEEAKKAAATHWKDPIVTEITAFTNYYPAEGYHQEYYAQNSRQPYCSFVIAPKIKKFREQFRDRLKPSVK